MIAVDRVRENTNGVTSLTIGVTAKLYVIDEQPPPVGLEHSTCFSLLAACTITDTGHTPPESAIPTIVPVRKNDDKKMESDDVVAVFAHDSRP